MSWHPGSGAMDPTAVQMQQIFPGGGTELQLQMSGVNGSLGPQRPPQLQSQQQQQLHAQQPQLMNLQVVGNPNNPPNVNVSGPMHAIRMQSQPQPITILNSLNLANGMPPPNTAINPANNNVRILPPQSVAQFPIDAQMSQISHQQFIVNAPIMNTGEWPNSGVPVTSSVASIQFVQRADGTVASQQSSQPLQPNVQTQEEPKQRLMLVQQQLIYLLHAYKCGKQQQQQPNATACNTPNCAHYKQILLHISSCHSSRTCSCTSHCLYRIFGYFGLNIFNVILRILY